MLTFDPDKHQYAWDGKVVPGVNEILRMTGQVKDWKDTPQFYRDRGTAVHKAIELFIKDELDEESVDEVIRPYLNQFKEWAKGENMAALWMSEKPFYSNKLVYAGTVDLIANECIYDIKCSKKLDKDSEWQYAVAGSAYRTLVIENWAKDFPYRILLLTGEGSAKVVPMFSPLTVWDHVMELYNIKTGRSL